MRLTIAYGSLIGAELNAMTEYAIQENILLSILSILSIPLSISLIGWRVEGIHEELARVIVKS